VLPRNNEFVYAFGKAYEEAFSDVPKEIRNEHWLMTLAAVPGVNRIIGVTQPEYSRFKTKEKVQKELDIRDVIRDGQFESLVKGYAWYKAVPLKEVTDFMSKQDDEAVVKRMEDQLKFAVKVQGLPHRSIWLSTYNMSTEGKARELVETLQGSTDVKRTQILKELGYVQAISGEGSGYNSDEFITAIGKYFKEKKIPTEKIRPLFEMMAIPGERQVQ
jgi:hypothetical protein